MTHYKSGKTPLIEVGEFSKRFNLPNLLIKDESKNSFGTWKDRRSEFIVQRAQKEGVDKLCLITAGNAGYSIAKFAQKTTIKVVSIVDVNLSSSIKSTLQKECHKVIEVNLSDKMLSPEEMIALARENDSELIWDITNGFHEAYESIIEEVEDLNPDYLICPVGSGEAFVGLHDGIKKRKLKTKLIGVRPKSNPSIADKLPTSWMLYQARIQAILEDGNKIVELTEEEIKSAYDYAKDHIDCETSSTVVISALSKIKFKESDKIILINSGKGII
ncbi:MAG: PLP-dependent lyase/thiolase [bacterium]|nr:PLP-dependent lyase/thiolase [bacterium]